MITITATELPLFMGCNGFRLMGDALSPINGEDLQDRNLGKTADWVVEQVFSKRIPLNDMAERKSPYGIYVTLEMLENLFDYTDTILKMGGGIEVVTTMAEETWSVGGRTDSSFISGRTLHVNDLKYGWSLIEPDENWTLMFHAISLILQRGLQGQIDNVQLTIYQPRPYHPLGPIRSWNVTVADLLGNYAARLFSALRNPEHLLRTGPHCLKCPALYRCPASLKMTMLAFESTETVYTDMIDNESLSSMLDKLKYAEKTIKAKRAAYEELAAHRVRDGQIVKNYVIDRQLGNREVVEEFDDAEFIALMTNNEKIVKKKLVTPKQMELAGVSKEFVSLISTRKDKGVKLVRVDESKRAEKAFSEFNNPRKD